MFKCIKDSVRSGAIFGSLLLATGALNATTIKICKQSSDASAPVSGTFTFTVDGSIVISLMPGQCDARIYSAGPHTIVEGVVLGTQLTNITVFPSDRQDTLDLAHRSVTVEAVAVPQETDVTFYNKPAPGNQGCTPGFWKNHVNEWPSAFNSTALVSSVFSGFLPAIGNETLLSAIQGGGGPGLLGAETILARAAVAALLNASSGVIAYPFATAEIISKVNTAVASGDRDTILALATTLDNANNGIGGCPLN